MTPNLPFKQKDFRLINYSSFSLLLYVNLWLYWPLFCFPPQGFVSVLDTPAVMYIWDQCFMQGWAPSVLKHFSLALLELLREKFMKARDYSQMKEVGV